MEYEQLHHLTPVEEELDPMQLAYKPIQKHQEVHRLEIYKTLKKGLRRCGDALVMGVAICGILGLYYLALIGVIADAMKREKQPPRS